MKRTKKWENRSGKLGEDVRRVNPSEDNNKKEECEGNGEGRLRYFDKRKFLSRKRE